MTVFLWFEVGPFDQKNTRTRPKINTPKAHFGCPNGAFLTTPKAHFGCPNGAKWKDKWRRKGRKKDEAGKGRHRNLPTA
jgi:hypothetical protein